MFTIIGAIISGCLKGLIAFFLPSKDQKLGQLEVTTKVQQETINDLEKADSARNDPALLDRVQSEYTRK